MEKTTFPAWNDIGKVGRVLVGGKPTYVVSTGILTGVLAVSQKTLLNIWHPATIAKRWTLVRLDVSMRAGAGTGSQTIQLWRTTVVVPSGGTVITPEAADQGDTVAAGGTFMAVPTTPSTLAANGPLAQTDAVVTVNYAPAALLGGLLLGSPYEGKLPVLRSGVAEGWAITQNVDVVIATTAPKFIVTAAFTEE